ncbi:kinesin family member 3Cb [Astyanax mexicanus]|uniref:Kinesin-like protein n=2 Tax=Astyanax mexicanus TaxID=7994 RepID=A0A8B9LC81_ASTMX|nr:kinesin family member 3Cb [Astyanax mexicanus]KAG9268501.1 kinesin-like protein KIF3B [Astyanax mexicanus]
MSKRNSAVFLRPRTMSVGKKSETIKVVVRCRPVNKKEEAMSHEKIVEVDIKLGQVRVHNPKGPGTLVKAFTFDAVYDMASKQTDLYDYSCKPLIDSVLQGFNGTVFAYGQTGTGKTYTMQGLPMDPERRGVIPNSFQHIFTHISRSQNQQYLVRVSYLEIYQDEIRDLVCKDNNKKLELKENPELGVYVKGLSSVVTKNIKEIEHVMNLGNQSRSVGFTKMNERSSRSHAIFVVTIECSEMGIDGEEHIRVGKLNMVDLAGSERQSKTGVQGMRFKEAAKINLSLCALGNVISALVDGKSSHIPYRDSKLTRLLQDSLGGNSKTVMVATIGPTSCHYEETLTTLRFANRAKNIKNRPKINEDPKDALLREFQEEIARLKAQLEERGMLAKERRRRRNSMRMKRSVSTGEVEVPRNREVDVVEMVEEESAEEHWWKQQVGQMAKNAANDSPEVRRKLGMVGEKAKTMEELLGEQQTMEIMIEKYKALESKLLTGGKNIIDHTNEQQRMLELKRQEIAEQDRQERDMQQLMFEQDEETIELKETFSTLQQEVDLKTKKLKKLYSKLQLVRAEIVDISDEHVTTRQELEQTLNELTREMKFKNLIIDNFIPPEEKNKIINRLHYDSEEDQWKVLPLLPSENNSPRVRRRPTSVVGHKRPISQHAQVAVATGAPSRYRAENVMLLELDMAPPAMVPLDLEGAEMRTRDFLRDFGNHRRRTTESRVMRARSWYQGPSLPTSSSTSSMVPESQCLPTTSIGTCAAMLQP